ncbi:MAG: hypothetical protein N3C12_00300 [Candidatus Binatia bacterium]|nr:hypothetical protein [Candidatus Binatia bacterium]
MSRRQEQMPKKSALNYGSGDNWGRRMVLSCVHWGLAGLLGLMGCTKPVRVPVSPGDAQRVGDRKPVAVTLWVDPSLSEGTYETAFAYATLGKVHLTVSYGPSLRETIRRAAQVSFARVFEGERCAESSSVLVRVDWAARPTLAMGWDTGFREGARGHVELPLRVIVSDCDGRLLMRRTVLGSYAGEGGRAGALNAPGEDDFAPIINAGLQDVANKLTALFASVPVPAAPVAQNQQ